MQVLQYRSISTVTIVATVFLSAFLLFQVQPILAKFILPWFGGAPAVWTICILFFQTTLLGGYAYAHLLSNRLPIHWQAITHAAVLFIAVVFLPITPDDGWKESVIDNPTLSILLLLGASVGIPYFVLSSTGTLLQAWFHRLHPDHSPYPLYAVSNGGSLLALLSYPFIVEPLLQTTTQTSLWSWGFLIFALLCGGVAYRLSILGKISESSARTSHNLHLVDRKGAGFLWFVLPACASILLLATTNHITHDVAVIPFLWIVPLSLYLLSFILCFDSDRWYKRRLFGIAFTLLLGLICYDLYPFNSLSFLSQIVIYNAFLFVASMICHGEIAQLRPHPSKLTSFYLSIAAGGALGGVFVGLIAPLIFNSYFELHIGILACYLIFPCVWFLDEKSFLYGGRPIWAWGLYFLGAVALGIIMDINIQVEQNGVIESSRNFYGVLRVLEDADDDHPTRTLSHGGTTHGFQFMETERRQWPTAYYGGTTGVGRLMEYTDVPERQVGVVGLGIGTLSAYGRVGDSFRYYEINPEVVRIAHDSFYYLTNSDSNTEIVAGDALLAMEREPSQNYDVLVLDAFSGDAIPVHLLTEEAFTTYARHLKQDGAISVHISNRYLDLRPVIWAAGDSLGFDSALINSPASDDEGISAAIWIVLTNNGVLLEKLRSDPHYTERDQGMQPQLWTTNYSNIFNILRD